MALLRPSLAGSQEVSQVAGLQSITSMRLSVSVWGLVCPLLLWGYAASAFLQPRARVPAVTRNGQHSTPSRFAVAPFRLAATQNPLSDTQILKEAEPHIQKLRGHIVVVKYGGHAMENDDLKAKFAQDIALLKQLGVNVVVVHGGGPQIAAMLKRLGVESNFVQGLRVTDEATLEVAEMVLCGKINKEISALVKKAGARSVGLSGKDDGLLIGERVTREVKDEQGNVQTVSLGFVGEPKRVNIAILQDLLSAGVVPVVAPIGLGEDGETLNINADTAASFVAGALRAKRLLLLTDVPGVLDKEKKLIPQIKLKQVEELKADGTVTGGMIPKIEMAAGAVDRGVEGAVILDGRVPHAVLLQLLSDKSVGTLVSDAEPTQ